MSVHGHLPGDYGSSVVLFFFTVWHWIQPFSSFTSHSYFHISLPVPPLEAFQCAEHNCTIHRQVLESYCKSLCNTLKVSAELTLLLARQRREISGWSDSAGILKSIANFWHRVWKEAGCPCSGVLFEIKCHSRSHFKYKVRRLKRREKHIRRKKLADALSSRDSNAFWSQVRQINSNKSPSSSPVVDSVCGADNTSNLFSAKLQSLLNCRSTTTPDELLSSLKIADDEISSFSFSEECVTSALSHLKPGKCDGSPLSSNYFIEASSLLVSILPPLLTVLVRHSYLPADLRNCILKPIPKPHNDPISSENYRPIALAPILSKILEWCILIQFNNYFVTFPLQFGFMKSMCIPLSARALWRL